MKYTDLIPGNWYFVALQSSYLKDDRWLFKFKKYEIHGKDLKIYDFLCMRISNKKIYRDASVLCIKNLINEPLEFFPASIREVLKWFPEEKFIQDYEIN